VKLWLAAVVFLMAATACYPTTTRPPFEPGPAAPHAEVELFVPQATREAALALNGDSIPVMRTEPKDGWLETGWFDARTLQPTTARPLGENVVKLRAWIEPSKPNYSMITIETVYRPLVDPSRDERSLERQVSDSSPMGLKVQAILKHLTAAFGDSTATPTVTPKKSGP
jgi:hypothetical protein